MPTISQPIPGKRRVLLVRKPRRAASPQPEHEPGDLTARLARLRAQALASHEADVALFAQWKAEAEKMTPEERAAETLAFEKLMASINETRAINGERLIY